MKEKIKMKHKVKDSVFTNLFKREKYRYELYMALHPKDKDVVAEDVKLITLKAIFTNNVYNDLGMITKNRLIILVEAQSTWSVNILLRDLLYLANTYKEYFTKKRFNLYSSKKIEVPIPELYVIYTGDKKVKKEYSLNEEYFGGKAPIDLKIKVITNGKNWDIIEQYIEFTNLADEYRKSKKSLKELMDTCIERNILKEYIIENYKEVLTMVDILFDQDTVTEFWLDELINESKNEGKQEGLMIGKQEGLMIGKQEGLIQGQDILLDSLVKQGLLTKEEAKKQKQLVAK